MISAFKGERFLREVAFLAEVHQDAGESSFFESPTIVATA